MMKVNHRKKLFFMHESIFVIFLSCGGKTLQQDYFEEEKSEIDYIENLSDTVEETGNIEFDIEEK